MQVKLKYPGHFIAIDGPDAVGKSTIAKIVAERLQGSYTKEPYGKIESGTAYEYIVDRYKHLTKEILPRLESGLTVVCDRYYLSTKVYNNPEQGQPVGFLVPNQYFVLVNSDFKLLAFRHKKRGEEYSLERIEELHNKFKGLDRYAKVIDIRHLSIEQVVEVICG